MRDKYRIAVAGYLVRFPIGGYAWQAAHYLLGLKALGHDVWFYEETEYYAEAYNPETQETGPEYAYGLAAASRFLASIGFDAHWTFVDSARGVEYGPGAGRASELMRDADVLINVGGVNRIAVERRNGRPAIYIDLDPGYTQLLLANGDGQLKAMLDEHACLFSFGENIGTERSPLPTGGYVWHPTRQPIAIDLWALAGPPRRVYTTIGQWNSDGRDLAYRGETFHWRKRTEWLRFLELPARANAGFEVAMNVELGPGDVELLSAHGWRVIAPLEVSIDPWRYRDYIRGSRGEFTVAKDMNVRLRSGWFSDRAASYLAAGRPVITQDTGFGDVLPVGFGLHGIRDVDEAAAAVQSIESDYERASRHAAEVAGECFEAGGVLRRLLHDAGM